MSGDNVELALLSDYGTQAVEEKGYGQMDDYGSGMETKTFKPPNQSYAPPGGGGGKVGGSDLGHDLPESLREYLDTTSTLQVPPDLIVEFTTVDDREVKTKCDEFNSLDQELERQNEMKIKDYAHLVDSINQYDQDGDIFGIIGGHVCCLASIGLYWLCNRRTVEDGYFGHFESSGRTLIKESGVHTLWSMTDNWRENIEIVSDEYVRQIGSKFLLTVPENYLGGATECNSQKFILFKQGRYVLDDADYVDIVCVALDQFARKDSHITELGTVKIVYIKEGYLGGAYEINTGKYVILRPGPPYILHDQAYQEIQVVKRKLPTFRIGPMVYVTVQPGWIAGAWRKGKDAKYQILVPGNTYQLNDKDFELENGVDLIERTENFNDPNNPGFSLGPYTFMTVKRGYVAGVYKQKGGDFIVLPHGHTYQLHVEVFREPVMVKKDSHIVKCGPLTFVTIQPDCVVGAYNQSTGDFENFSATNRGKKEIVFNENTYRDLQCIPKYNFEKRDFGPYKTITIRDGYVGIFEREGKRELQSAGWYMKESEYRILPSIPIQVFTISSVLSNGARICNFKSKDGVDMSIVGNLVWQVTDPKKTALIDGGFEDLQEVIKQRFLRMLTKFAKQYNRDELLPTTQNIISKKGGGKVFGKELDDLIKQSVEASEERFKTIEKATHEAMVEASDQSNWGVTIRDTTVETVILEDQRIIYDIDQMCRSIINTSLQTYKGELEVVRATNQKNVTLKQEKMRIDVQELRANYENNIRKTDANCVAAIKKIRSDVAARNEVHNQTANSRIEVLKSTTEAEAEAKARDIKLAISNKERLEGAKAQSEAIKMKASAEYEAKVKENEAISKITDKQFKLQMADRSVIAMAEMGEASWKMPDQILQFYESFSPYLRMGSIPAGDLLKAATNR